jgi:uncharacterized protein YecE (DUF72 family)
VGIDQRAGSDRIAAMLPIPGYPKMRVGTSSFSSEDWVGNFYPEGTMPRDYLVRYAEKLDTVEIDATFYRIPSPRQVAGWRDRTPPGFLFSAKVPQSVTHADLSDESLDDLQRFIDVMRPLGPKLGPLVFQFPYISKARAPEEYATGEIFRSRLGVLLDRAPADLRYAVEVRNERWVGPPLLEVLRARKVALAFIDYYTMPGMLRAAGRRECVTADFAYFRFLGNHREMDAMVEKKKAAGGRRWEALVQDRSREMGLWAPVVAEVSARADETLVYFNNHYAGHAPSSIDLFLRALAGAT